jgi:hypothetical protein
MIRRIPSALAKPLQICVLSLSLLAVPAVSHAAFISFGTATTNLSQGPTTYTFFFGTPIVPEMYGEATATASLTLTSAPESTATVTIGGIYASYLSGYGNLAGTPTNLGVDLGTTTCTSTNAVATICDFGFTTNTFGPTFFDGLEALLTYDQTGLNSTAVWTARVDIETRLTTAPEPASMLLLGTGLLGAGVRRWRQRRT